MELKGELGLQYFCLHLHGVFWCLVVWVLWPGKSHGQRSLVGCSPWGLEESETTERLHFHFSLSCSGERNGTPLQCSCLENPRDGGSLVGCRLWGLRVGHDWIRLSSSSSSSLTAEGMSPPAPYWHCCLAVSLTWNFSFLICAPGEVILATLHKSWRWLSHVNLLERGLPHGQCSVKADYYCYLFVFSGHFLGVAAKRTAHGLRLILETLCSWVYITWKNDYPLLPWKDWELKK